MSRLKSRISSFKWAFNGLKLLFTEEANAKIHLFAAIVTILLGVILHIDKMEWIAVIFAIATVIAAEIINTSIEQLADVVSPEKRMSIKKVKDLAAAAVLVTAIAAFLTGIIIFLPKLVSLI